MNTFFEYYRLTTSDKEDDSCYKFTRVKEEDIKIMGYTIKEIIDIIVALDIERITQIKVTMANLHLIYNELNNRIQERLLKNLEESFGITNKVD